MLTLLCHLHYLNNMVYFEFVWHFCILLSVNGPHSCSQNIMFGTPLAGHLASLE